MFFYLTLYLQNVLGFSALDAGLRFLPLSALGLIGAPIAGALTDRVGPRPFMTPGLALIAVGVALMTRISPHDQQVDWIVLLPAFIIAGIGNGMVNPPISTVTVGTVRPERAGMASGVNSICRQLGTAFGIAFLGAVLTSQYNGYIHDRVLAVRPPASVAAQLTPAVKGQIVRGIQQAGTIATIILVKCSDLRGDPQSYH